MPSREYNRRLDTHHLDSRSAPPSRYLTQDLPHEMRPNNRQGQRREPASRRPCRLCHRSAEVPLMLPTLVMVLARSMHWKGPLVLLVLLVLVLVLVLVPRPPQAHPPMPMQAQSSPTPNPLKSCRPTSPASQQSGPQYSQVSPSRPYPTPP